MIELVDILERGERGTSIEYKKGLQFVNKFQILLFENLIEAIRRMTSFYVNNGILLIELDIQNGQNTY